MHNREIAEGQVQPTTKPIKIALTGNPNAGKTSVFNLLTGLRQKVGNFPGVTVEKKVGKLDIGNGQLVDLIDFPGTYSLYPNAQDERIVVQTLVNPQDPNYPDAVIYISNINMLEKHFLLFTQLKDLGLPVILALNMIDEADREGLKVDTQLLARKLKIPVVTISGRTGAGIPELKRTIAELKIDSDTSSTPTFFYSPNNKEKKIIEELQPSFPDLSDYQTLLLAHHYQWLPFLDANQKDAIGAVVEEEEFQSLKHQVSETMTRFDQFTPLVKRAIQHSSTGRNKWTETLDRWLTHRVAGPFVFIILMLLVFQAIYAWATYPMDWIETAFATISGWVTVALPEGWLTSLITDGLLAGLGGIMVFIPQIAILFFLISLLEEVGYMARAAYMFDRLMQFFGLNGRSVVALISGGACAIPAIMSTRTIGNWKERLITIMVTPLISCSARIPVYTVLIGFVVPSSTVLGFFNLQGLAFMGLYLLGIVAALLSALVFKWILKSGESSFLMLELPEYRLPVARNVGLTVWEKVRTFILEAGKVILVISIVLWVLASYGPKGDMQQAEAAALETARQEQMDEAATQNLVASKRIEASFAGQLGKLMEPAIRPLGFDWKIGIALITSFAAREVFVGTMSTIYSIGSDADEFSVRDRMAQERNPITGAPVYTMGASLALLLFYVFAMQCMSTLAVVRKETGSWKWPTIQFVFMTALAYLSALIAFQGFS